VECALYSARHNRVGIRCGVPRNTRRSAQSRSGGRIKYVVPGILSRGDEELDEDTPPGDDFLAKLCVDWENAASPARGADGRVVLARVGIVCDAKTGALAKMLTPFKMFVGGPVGSGQQFYSWIHIDDIAEMFCFALHTPAASGPMNVTAPNPLTNKDFGKVIGKVLGRPSFFWTPGFLIKLGLGEGAQLVLTGQRVLPKRAIAWGFKFAHPDLAEALAHLLGRKAG
jgi:uncharacterized protein (TIGR01777 family)